MTSTLDRCSEANMNTLIVSIFACVFLSKVVLTTALKDSKIYFILNGFREQEYRSRLTGLIRNAVECVFECKRMPTCSAVNFHTGDKVCELLEPGSTPLYPKTSTGWTFCYTDSKHLYHYFNAVASQKSTWYDSIQDRGADGLAEFGIDGNTDSNYYHGSCFHSGRNTTSPWWMVDLFLQFRVERIILWNRHDWGCGGACYLRLRDLTITVSPTQSGVDDPDNVCATYPGPPSSPSDNPVVVNCSRVMLGRYIKITKQTNEYFHLCEIDFA